MLPIMEMIGGKSHQSIRSSINCLRGFGLFLCIKAPKIGSRTITSLLCAMKELGLGTGKIVTLDEEKILKEICEKKAGNMNWHNGHLSDITDMFQTFIGQNYLHLIGDFGD